MKTGTLVSSLLAATVAFSAPPERATYQSAGGLTSLINDGQQFPLKGEFIVSFEGGVRATVQPHDQRSEITRDGSSLHWTGLVSFPNSSQAQFDARWTESPAGVALVGSVTSGGLDLPGAPTSHAPLLVGSIDYVIDLPHAVFAGWTLDPGSKPLPAAKPTNATFFQETVNALAFFDSDENWRLSLTLDEPRVVSVTDVWEGNDRVFRVRIRLGSGTLNYGESKKLSLTLSLTGKAHSVPTHLAVDPSAQRYPFDGFGGNYCFANQPPAADYLLDNLHQAWARLEFKAHAWDSERNTTPGPELLRDFALMQRVQKLGVPWILSLWRLPEHFYTDANQKSFASFGRQISADRWPEFLDLLGSYLVYLKKSYGAEPDYFSFNEPDLGVNIGFTGETHRDAIKRIGAHFASLGLKTKLLLGDTANPRDSHKYVLPTAADADAMRYVGAISFHSWGGGTPAQYKAWGDVASWLGLPLVVAEAGTDPGSFRNHMFDSYSYGLGEMRQFQELLRDSQPVALIFWEFTEDYGLLHVSGAEKHIDPTGRFWLIRHFTNLTPPKSTAVACSSDRTEVLVSAFTKDNQVTVHILNTGPASDATVTGLPAGRWIRVTTTEADNWVESTLADASTPLPLPARSLTTLVRTNR